MATIGRGAARGPDCTGGRTHQGRDRRRSPGAPCTWRCSRPARTARRRHRLDVGRVHARARRERISVEPRTPTPRPLTCRAARGDRHDDQRSNGCPRADEAARSQQQPADVFVIFGITGDLAKVMTFHSLYRLEQRGPARLPDRRRRRRRLDGRPPARARPRVHRGHRRARSTRRSSTGSPRRLSYVAGRLRRRRPPTSGWREAIKGAAACRSSTWRSRRSCSARWSQGLAEAGLTAVGPGRGREAVRPRPGLGPGARRRAAPVRRRVAALPDRPLPRQDGPGGAALPAVRQHDARAGLEPQLRRVACRSRWPRASASRTAATSTTRSARCATWWSTT